MTTNTSKEIATEATRSEAPQRIQIGKAERRALRERADLVRRGPLNTPEVCAAVNLIFDSGHYKHDCATWEEYCVRFFYWSAADVQRFTELYRVGRWAEVTSTSPGSTELGEQMLAESKTKAVTSDVSSQTPQRVEWQSIELPLTEIILDTSLQCRANRDETTVENYAALLKEDPEALPAPAVIRIEGRHILADGAHRHAAAVRLGWKSMKVKVLDGTRADAIRVAIEQNASHGLAFTTEDKTRAITLVLNELSGMSDRAVAELCKASHTWVRKVRAQLETVSSCSPTRKGKDGRCRKLPKRNKPTQSPAAPGSQSEKAVVEKSPTTQADEAPTAPTDAQEEENPEAHEPFVGETKVAYDFSMRLKFLRDTCGGEIERCPVELRNNMIDEILDFAESQRPETD